MHDMIVRSNSISNRNSPLNPQFFLFISCTKTLDSAILGQFSMALHICQPKHRSLINPSLIHLFSTSQNNNNNNDDGNDNNSSQSSQSQYVSFQELDKRNTNNDAKPRAKLSLAAIGENFLKRISVNRSNVGSNADSLSLSAFKNSLNRKLEGGNANTVIGGTQETPVFGKGKLNERLMRSREMEEKENESRIGWVSTNGLGESLVRLKALDEGKAKMSQLGGIPISKFLLHPPKEHLVEKFKMAESDIGSAWVQIEQLTTKIKHLSSVLQQIVNEYNELFATQLENQKLYYETLLREVEEETDKRRTSEYFYKVMAEKLPEMRYKLYHCNSEKNDLREILLEVQEIQKAKISEMEEREKTALRAKDDKIQYLEEQLRNLMVNLEAEKEEEQLSISNEIKDGTLLPMSVDSSTSNGTKVGKGKKSNRGRRG